MAKTQVEFVLHAEIEASRVADVRDTLAVRYGWTPESSESKTEMIERHLITVAKRDYMSAKGVSANGAAESQADQDFEV